MSPFDPGQAVVVNSDQKSPGAQSKALIASELQVLFDQLFLSTTNTRLIAGEDEPIYLPADDQSAVNRLVFAHGFYESALHEISHWCIAGEERLKQVDFGYWYEPDGRSESQQRAFEQVEAKPQALEWILSEACGRRFQISTDNLDADPAVIEAGRQKFAYAVWKQTHIYLKKGLPARAEVLKQALLDYYQRRDYFADNLFVLERLR
jgi:elongation factor P hydroxylase